MDTGIVPHVDFGNRIRYFGDFCEGKTGLYDDNGHGTHVSGIVAGSGEASRKEYGTPVCHGIAPQADIVMLKVLDAKGNGNTRDVLAGMEWIAKNQQEYQIRLLNISVGMLPSAGESGNSRNFLARWTISGTGGSWLSRQLEITALRIIR